MEGERKVLELKARRMGFYASYLGAYWERPTGAELGFLRGSQLSVRSRAIIENYDFDRIRKLLSALLIKDGRQNYRIMHSFEVVESFFSEDENSLLSEVTIVLVSKAEVENKRRWEMLYQFAIRVVNENKYLLIITDHKIRNELETFREMGFRVIVNESFQSKSRGNSSEF